MFRKIWEEANWEDGFGRCVEEAGQADTRGSANGGCTKLEGDTYR